MECFFCKLPLTSDDFKNDRIEETKSFIVHKTCVEDFEDRAEKHEIWKRRKIAEALEY